MNSLRTSLAACVALLGACHAPASSVSPTSPDNVAPWAAPALSRAVSVRDGRTGAELSFDALLDELARADAVFLGETHLDETTHRVELAVYEGLLERRGGDVVLALEMFERDVQAQLDDYLAGTIDESTFLERTRPWGNYRTAYRPLIERARADGRKVVASNFPRPLRMRVAMEGLDALADLPEGQRDQAPDEILANTPQYWRRSDNAVRGHLEMMRRTGDDDPQRLSSTQTLWDNAMGDACARALAGNPGAQVLHVNGGFHSLYWDGTVRQMRLRAPGARVATVAIEPVGNPATATLGGAPMADYVVFAEARAADVDDGAWSVTVPRELDYRLHLPEGASDEAPVPLLIWLGDDGLRAQDGLQLWKDRLGDECAIAVVQPFTLETQPDLSLGGLWFRADSFLADTGALIEGVERIWGYLLRNQPVDPARVCLAGEGTGATMVAAIALLTGRLDANAVALSPRRYTKIKDFPLPLPELRGEQPAPDISLRLALGARDAEWWDAELQAYEGIGFDANTIAGGDDPWNAELRAENALRAALALPARPAPSKTRRDYVLAQGDSPRARHWARLVALRHAAQEDVAVAVLTEVPDDASARPVPTDIRAEDYAEKGALPKCPGPFGGTTVLVVGADAGPAVVQSWTALEENDPLAAAGRFHRLRVATAEPGRTLPELLAELHDEGRDNVLIVPAAFCADAATMRTLKLSVADSEDRMTLHWSPGLGGS
ncbi:MAG: ChaN family lipoprotein [Planctomycetota bacterium]|jgi:uncharacterized iron-regulated protein